MRKAKREARRARRNKKPELDRKVEDRSLRSLILIVCEGKNTEHDYFKKMRSNLRLPRVQIEVKGVGKESRTIIKKAEGFSNQPKLRDIEDKQVWCVFDADPNPSNPASSLKKFDEDIKEAKEKDFHVAFSHQTFEYWLILHFNAHQGGKMDRKSYNKIINDELKKYDLSYDGKGSKEVSRKFFEWLIATPDGETQSRMDTAIERAKKIHDTHKKNGTPPSQWESCTTVYELVEELLKYKEH